MSNLQLTFNLLFDLLSKQHASNPLLQACLQKKQQEIVFSTFAEAEGHQVSKKQILEIYEGRAAMEQNLRPSNPFVIGYETLLPALRNCSFEHVNISDICSSDGMYIIFTDYDFTAFLGILQSKRSLAEIRERMQGDSSYTENLFINGILQS